MRHLAIMRVNTWRRPSRNQAVESKVEEDKEEGREEEEEEEEGGGGGGEEEEEEDETDLSSLSSAELKMHESTLVFPYALMACGMVLNITQGHGSTHIQNRTRKYPYNVL